MTQSPLDSLQAQLSLAEDTLALLRELPLEIIVQMVALTTETVETKDRALAKALDNAVTMVPAPLRRSVRKLLAG